MQRPIFRWNLGNPAEEGEEGVWKPKGLRTPEHGHRVNSAGLIGAHRDLMHFVLLLPGHCVGLISSSLGGSGL